MREEKEQYHKDTTIIIKEYYAKKVNILGETDKFLKTYNMPRLNKNETDNVNRPVTSSENEFII